MNQSSIWTQPLDFGICKSLLAARQLVHEQRSYSLNAEDASLVFSSLDLLHQIAQYIKLGNMTAFCQIGEIDVKSRNVTGLR